MPEEGQTGWHVAHKEDFDRSYFVGTTPSAHHCSCPQFAKAGVCKHEYFATDYEEETGVEVKSQTRRASLAAQAMGAGIWGNSPPAERMQAAHNAQCVVEWYASEFNDRIY